MREGYDLFLKTQWLLEQGRGIVFSTGTPIANTIAESWTMARYLMRDKLERGYVKPVCVVDDDRDGLMGGKVTQQVQCRQRDEEDLRAGPCRAEGIQKQLPLPVRQAIGRGHHRTQ